MRRVILPILLILLAAGCVDRISGGNDYSENWADRLAEHGRVPLYDPAEVDICGDVECWAMVCTNSSNIWGVFTSFVGADCRFENLAGTTHIDDPAERYEASQERYNYLTNGSISDMGIRHFMVGAGPTFADFGEANRWCNNQLKMAVQWLIGDVETAQYSDVDPSRAICLLDKEVMPVYVLYSGGAPNVTRAGAIADTLYHGGSSVTHGQLWGPVGPIIITTEMDADLSDDATRELVLEQAVAMKDQCPNGRDGEVYCMVALGARMDDITGVQATLEDPRSENFDLVAFGMNSHRAHSCDYNDLYLDAYNFSSFVWQTFKKPTVMPYMLFDSGGEVLNEDGSVECEWTEAEMIRGYNAFFPNLPAFLETGVIGASPYDFNSTLGGMRGNPMSCEDCSIGKNIDRMQSWFGGCQGFTGIMRVETSCADCAANPEQDCCAGEFSPTPGIPIVFPNQTGGRCNFNEQWDSLLHMQYGAGGLRDFGSPMTPDLFEPMEPYVRCDACMNEQLEFPYAGIIEPRGVSVSAETRERFPGLTDMEIACTAYPMIDSWASTHNIDPLYARAVAIAEGGMDMCAAACSCRSGTDCPSRCIPGKYSAGYNFMEDPSGECNYNLEPQPDPDAAGETPSWRWMATGLMQTMTSPYTFWPREEFCIYEDSPSDCGVYEDQFIDAVQTRDGGTGQNRRTADNPDRAITQCGYDFNPFDPADSACMGTYDIARAVEMAGQVVDEYRTRGDDGDLFGIRDNPDKERVLEYYIAGHIYFGTWGNDQGAVWITEFEERKDWTNADCVSPLYLAACHAEGDMKDEQPYCWGIQDFIDYVYSCKLNYYDKTDSGYNKLAVYMSLMGYNSEGELGAGGCENVACPSWRRLQEGGDFDVPEESPYAHYESEPPGSVPDFDDEEEEGE
ncbi:MAG: hypothetical protein ABII71_03385 [Candidatus Micrarchaeota archaeon]